MARQLAGRRKLWRRGTRRCRAPRGGLPGGETAHHARPVSADAELAAAGVQPVHQSRSGGRLRRGHHPLRPRSAHAPQVDHPRELVHGALGQVQAPARPGARPQRSRAGADDRVDAARPADTRRAARAQRPHPSLRVGRRARFDARGTRGPHPGHAAAAPPGRARAALRAAAVGRRGRGRGAPRAGRAARPRPSRRAPEPPAPAPSLEPRVERLEREVAALGEQLQALRDELGA